MTNRSPISAFVITYNEAAHIAECLESLDFCDEILVVDSFSEDETVSIAKSYGARVLQHKWEGYRGQKAFGLVSVTHEWVINIDADERISPELKESILSVSSCSDDGINGYYINRLVYYLGRWWRNGGWYPEYRLRFFRKSKATWGGTDPHEKVEVEGKTEKLTGDIYHYTYKNLEDQFERLQNFSTVAAKEDFIKGKKFSLAKLLISPVVRTLKFYILKRGYREGVAGLVVAMAEGYYTFMKYAKLWEHHFNNSEKGKK